MFALNSARVACCTAVLAVAWSMALPMLLWPQTAEAGVRCDGQVVETGDRSLRVRSLCGEPDLIDAPVVFGYLHPGLRTETWYYNFGPRQLIRVMRFRDSRLVEIDQDGYGFRDDAGGGCDGYDIVDGLSKFRLLARCGQPAERDVRRVIRRVHPSDFHGAGVHLAGQQVEVLRERWTYNFGSDQLLRIAWLENGRVVDVEFGERGYDARD